MPKYTTAEIRNIAMMGTAGGGKTTLIEHFLHEAGSIGRIGRVEDGNTVSDYEDLEKEFTCSFDSALVHFDYDGAHFNAIDTPGRNDFLGKALSVIPAVETAVVVFDAGAGVGPVGRRVMKMTAERRIPRLIVINKIDHAESIEGILENIQETFGNTCRPVNLPAAGGTTIVDCLQTATGDSDLGDVAEHHTAIVDQVVEVDEALMEQYLEAGEIAPAALQAPFKRAMREGHLVPICFTNARDGVGIKELMTVIAELCPSPLEGNPRPFVSGSGEGETLIETTPDPAGPLLAHVFKVASDPYVGKLSVFRVHQGHVGSDVSPRIGGAKKSVRIAHCFKLQGKEHTEVETLIAGDIGAVAKIDEISYNCVLASGDFPEDVHLKALGLPKPMYGLAIEGTSKGAETKMGEALKKLVAEDPTLEVERVQATGETVLRGLGEQHLRVKLRLLKDRYGIEVATKPPRVAYKETISTKAEGHHRHKKQTGGAGQFGEVYLRVEPVTPEDLAAAGGDSAGLLFEDATFGGSVPKQYLPAIEKGVRQVMGTGAIAGYPMQNIKVSVYDGKHHPVDSKEVAFVAAGKRAFVDAVQKAKPVLLEPFVHMEITVPADLIGDVSSDLSGRRGRIHGTEMLPGNQAVVTAEAPLAEVMTYANQLKSMSAGAGSYAMEYSHDEATPPNVMAEVVKQFKPKDDED